MALLAEITLSISFPLHFNSFNWAFFGTNPAAFTVIIIYIIIFVYTAFWTKRIQFSHFMHFSLSRIGLNVLQLPVLLFMLLPGSFTVAPMDVMKSPYFLIFSYAI